MKLVLSMLVVATTAMDLHLMKGKVADGAVCGEKRGAAPIQGPHDTHALVCRCVSWPQDQKL